MSNIKGLIIKDIYNLSNYKKTMISVIIFIITFSFLGQINMLTMMIILMIAMIGLSTFSYDEVANSDKYILSLPTNRKEIVLSRYILIILINLIGVFISLVITSIVGLVIGKVEKTFLELIALVIGNLMGIALLQSIQVPCMYKWGVEKAKVQSIIILMSIGLVLFGIFMTIKYINVGNTILSVLSGIPEYAYIIALVLILALMYYISYRISLKIYNKKEI